MSLKDTASLSLGLHHSDKKPAIDQIIVPLNMSLSVSWFQEFLWIFDFQVFDNGLGKFSLGLLFAEHHVFVCLSFFKFRTILLFLWIFFFLLWSLSIFLGFQLHICWSILYYVKIWWGSFFFPSSIFSITYLVNFYCSVL